MTSKTTKRALVSSLLAIVLCVAMLVGATFAWFTDTASTGVNKIQTGKLDVELEYSYNMNEWYTADATSKIFDDSIRWEPGVTQVVYLRVRNNGDLALKYNLNMNSSLQSSWGRNMANDKYYIGDYVKLGTATVNTPFTAREAAWNAVAGNANVIKNFKGATLQSVASVLPQSTSDPLAIVIYLPTDVGNEANAKSKTYTSKLSFLGIELYASQATVESDSFNNTYDKNAADVLGAQSASYGTHEITKNIQASGRYGAVQAEKNAQFTIDADVYAVYTKGSDGLGAAIAVQAGGTSNVIINGGDFRQVDVPEDDQVCDLIYALDKATITINGGTFKAVDPTRTLNVQDAAKDNAKIIVQGGSFYQYDPSNASQNNGEVFVADGYKVVQEGDWYTVVPNA